MINPLDIDFSSMPYVALEDRDQLPTTPCIYFAIDSQNVIQYIGRSINPQQRWMQHHRYNQLSGIGAIRIAYLAIDAPDLLPSIEEALIDWFAPSLNATPIPRDAPAFEVARARELRSRLPVLMAEQEPPLTQSDLVQRLGLGSHTVSRLYNNTFQRIDTETIEKLCRFFKCGLEDILELKNFGMKTNETN